MPAYSWGLRLADVEPPPGERTLLQPSDFTMVGMFRVPAGGTINGGVDFTMSNAGGLTHYYNGSQLRMFSSAFVAAVDDPMHVYEFIAPARNTWTMDPNTCPRATAPTTPTGGYWGVMSSGDVDQGMSGLLYRDVGGQKRLYMVGGSAYTDQRQSSICYAVLNHGAGTHTKHGPWKVYDDLNAANASMKFVNSTVYEVSAYFADTYLNGERVVFGSGGGQSLQSAGPTSMGPAAYSVIEADFGTVSVDGNLRGIPLIGFPWHSTDYGTPTRFQRPGTYDSTPPWGTMTGPPIPPAPEASNGGPFAPAWAPNGDPLVYWWNENDWTNMAACFYDDGTKWGYLQFQTFVNGRTYYYRSELRAEAIRFHRFCIDPLALAAVAAGDDTMDTPQAEWFDTQETPELDPTDYDVDQESDPADSWEFNAPAGGVKVRGVTVDYNGAFTSGKPLLFLNQALMAPSGPQPDPLIVVYEIG